MIYLSDVQQNKIDGIVDQYVDACRKSNKETAYQDAERKGMDAVRKYCKQAGLPLLGYHMIKASNTLSNI